MFTKNKERHQHLSQVGISNDHGTYFLITGKNGNVNFIFVYQLNLKYITVEGPTRMQGKRFINK